MVTSQDLIQARRDAQMMRLAGAIARDTCNKSKMWYETIPFAKVSFLRGSSGTKLLDPHKPHRCGWQPFCRNSYATLESCEKEGKYGNFHHFAP